jgi:membrane-bound lytic murein transglycosylase D
MGFPPKLRRFSFFLVPLLACGLGAGLRLGLSAFDRPVSWSDLSAMDLRPILRSEYGSESNLYQPSFNPSSIDLALRDADSRVDREFRVPKGIQPVVRFWLKIYTEYSTRQVVLHDERHPEVIYEVLDYRKLAKTARNRAAYEIVSERRTRAAMARYRKAFARLARHPHPRHADETETRILTALKATSHHHSMRVFARGLRAQTGQRDNVIKGLIAAESFFPQMEKIFSELGVPPEITRLSLVESSFNLKAVSRVGAAGVWQFMPRSAHEFMHLDSSGRFDERLSPLKSSAAAARLLKRSYRMLGSWPLAITSYNNGYRGLRKIARDPKRANAPFTWLSLCGADSSPLGWASRNYYSSFLAVLHAETYRDVFYGDGPRPMHRRITFARVTRAETALTAASRHHVPMTEFRFYNPDILDVHARLPRGYVIALPAQEDNFATLLNKDRRRSRHQES